MNAATDFTGGGLSFSVAGEGVSVDPATGVLRILTDALRDGIEITVTATNSGGAATTRFRLTWSPSRRSRRWCRRCWSRRRALPAPGRVGAEIVAHPGRWSGVPDPELALQWLRDGAAIEGATAAAYVPGAADDRAALRCRVTAGNAAGRAEAETEALAITHAAPVAGSLDDLDLELGSGPRQVDAAAAFTGQGLVYAVTGAGASIDAATGLVSIPTDAVLAGAEVTVTARNSGGAASLSFRVDVAVAWPADIPAGLWQVSEITDPDEAAAAGHAGQPGHLKAVFGAHRPGAGRLHAAPRHRRPRANGSRRAAAGGRRHDRDHGRRCPVGDTAYPRLYWRHTATGTFKIAVEHGPVVIQGLKLEAPVLLDAPSLAGTGRIGQEVCVDPGRWGGKPAPALAVRWLRDGTEIAGATGPSYHAGGGRRRGRSPRPDRRRQHRRQPHGRDRGAAHYLSGAGGGRGACPT